ncbi:MAG: 3-dehydroquinate synthase [Xanthobacteraceae bacterium]|nr:3-dehydroquinate synthase [Xanthobacteraceae bacterium]MCW5672969.1 3-dehydroquinate synthase [Xanthobacteraceae bacterium]
MPAPKRTRNEIVKVRLGKRSYDIVIGENLIAEAGKRIAKLKPGTAVAIVTDGNVAHHHLGTLERSLEAANIRYRSVLLSPGESTKSFSDLQTVAEAILESRIERGDLVVALGGGVIGDLAGFAASVVRRGVGFVQIPTTLLAQVDSSVGGKTGINSPQGKNLIGAFHQPSLVLADLRTLDTLPPREFRAGYGEVAKYGLINDAKFFAWLEKHAPEIFAGGPARAKAVATSCKAKAAIVARDEREAGDRALLNLGHTFGHALEAATGYSDRLLHGEGVALGCVLAFKLSAKLRLCKDADVQRVIKHIAGVGLPVKLSQIPGALPNADALLSLMAQDKKVQRGKLVFILAKGIGKAFIAKNVDPKVVREVLKEALAE